MLKANKIPAINRKLLLCDQNNGVKVTCTDHTYNRNAYNLHSAAAIFWNRVPRQHILLLKETEESEK
jgi:hypothetical protein